MCPGAVSSRRYDAVRAGYVGDEALARSLTADSDPATRASALAALVRLGVATSEDLTLGAGDDDPLVRARSLRLLVGLDLANPPDLLAHLPDPDDGVTEVAAFVAGELHGPPGPADARVTDALSRVATTHDDALCRESAVAALGAIGDPAGLPAVL